jgi:hypothetical protein
LERAEFEIFHLNRSEHKLKVKMKIKQEQRLFII